MKLALLLFSVLVCFALLAETLRGKVVRVSDGDTIAVLCETNTQEKVVRLNRIDAPEKKQAYGDKSRRHLAEMVFGKEVKVEWANRDQYGRILGDVYVGSTNVCLQMVKDGMSWHYKHFDTTAEYAQAEKEASEKKLGLWADERPIEPWEFRKARKEAERAAREKEREEAQKQLEQLKEELQKARGGKKRTEEERNTTRRKPEETTDEPKRQREAKGMELKSEKMKADALLEGKIRDFLKKHVGADFGDSIEKFPQSTFDPEQRRVINLVEPRGYYDKAELFFTCGKLCSVCVFANFDKKYSRDSVDKQCNRTNASIEKALGLDERNFKLARGVSIGRYVMGYDHIDFDDRWYRGISISDSVMGDELRAQKKKEDNAKGETLPPLD